MPARCGVRWLRELRAFYWGTRRRDKENKGQGEHGPRICAVGLGSDIIVSPFLEELARFLIGFLPSHYKKGNPRGYQISQ